jgi:acyl-CoA thioester hydrolase
MNEPFERNVHGRWGEMDFNGHVRNTAYLDLAADLRMQYFAAQGFSMREFERLRLGPVITRDELEYFKEIRLLEPIRCTFSLAALSADGARFRCRNEFYRGDGKRAVRVTSTGGWLSLETRRMVPPPEELAAMLRALARSEDFAEL